jgi:hypothetical protein
MTVEPTCPAIAARPKRRGSLTLAIAAARTPSESQAPARESLETRKALVASSQSFPWASREGVSVIASADGKSRVK